MQKLILFLLLFAAADAQGQGLTNPLVPGAQKLHQAYEVLIKNKLSVTDQLIFIDAFPSAQYEFMTMFDPDHRKQLYDGYKAYIETFKETGNNFPDSILKKGLLVSNGMKWSTGPADMMQHCILEVAAAHPEKFVNQAYKLKRKELDAALSFLADVESNPECALYKKLLKNLHDVGAYNLEGMLIRTKTSTH